MRTLSLLLALAAMQIAWASGPTGITDIRITACAVDNCSIPGFRKVPQDLNKFSRGSFVHLHFSTEINHYDSDPAQGRSFHDDSTARHHSPITQIAVLQGSDAEMSAEWERVEGNLNHGNHGPVLTMFVQRDPTKAPIDSIVVKYGFDSHAAIGYDRLPVDLNAGTGGQWVYLYYRRQGQREPITHLATKACSLPPCTLDDSWTRVNRPIITGTFKRYLYFFYKSVPGERPITSLSLSLGKEEQGDGGEGEGEDIDYETIDTGVRYKKHSVYLTYHRGQIVENDHAAVDNIAVELGSNQILYGWNAASFDADSQVDLPDWNAQVIYRTGVAKLPRVPALRFKNDGSFKMMACTGDVNTLEMMERMLDAEHPDLVIFTGDNVDGVTSNDAYATTLKYSKPVVDRNIPWTIIFGNHDEEGDLSREEMMRSVQDIPYSLSKRGPLGISGTGNYVLSIYGHKHEHNRDHHSHGLEGKEGTTMENNNDIDEESNLRGEDGRFTLYFLDSGAYSFNLEYPGWDWIKDDQVEWFRQTSRTITSKYQRDDVPNAMAFFHIPIPEYGLIKKGDAQDKNRDEDEIVDAKEGKRRGHIVGEKNEGVSSPTYNSGLFDAVYESKDVRATTAGHDHINDYCLDLRGINLCYGGGLGYGSYGRPSFPRRSRVFEILNQGDRVDTWKRLDNEEMTMVGQQTLFSGKKSTSHSPAFPSRSHAVGPNKRPGQGPRRFTGDLFENLTRGCQYVMDGIRG
ncbi:hypothetical protein BGX28_003167 [Mortierella sp. GBA30]|nr:hypothetical protein BGX28_003167 [Mortierella sp. GBA30]